MFRLELESAVGYPLESPMGHGQWDCDLEQAMALDCLMVRQSEEVRMGQQEMQLADLIGQGMVSSLVLLLLEQPWEAL